MTLGLINGSKKIFNPMTQTFEDWILIRLAETGHKGFTTDEFKEIVDKACESIEDKLQDISDAWSDGRSNPITQTETEYLDWYKNKQDDKHN